MCNTVKKRTRVNQAQPDAREHPGEQIVRLAEQGNPVGNQVEGKGSVRQRGDEQTHTQGNQEMRAAQLVGVGEVVLGEVLRFRWRG